MSVKTTLVDYGRPLASWLAGLVFPIRCIGCGELQTHGQYVCRTCLALVKFSPSAECIGCKEPATLGQTCSECQANGWHLDRVFSVTRLSQPLVERMVKVMKYQFVSAMSDSCFILLKRYARRLAKRKYMLTDQNPLITPVPLHPYRMRWRGFNQSELIARQLASFFQLVCQPSVLTRSRSATPQAEIENRSERLENVHGQFTCSQPQLVANKTILLIDDVVTTGATLNECALMLKQHGALSVCALVFARG